MLSDHDAFEFAGCLLVIPRREPRLFLLNQTAGVLWRAIARGMSPDAAAGRLALRFEMPPAEVAADVRAMLDAWHAHGLLIGSAPPASAAPMAEVPAAGPARDGDRRDRVYALCGRPIRFRFDDRATEQLIHPLIGHMEVPATAVRDTVELIRHGAGYLVVCNGTDIERATGGEQALGEALGRVLELSYPDASWLAVMHAAAVGTERAAVVMPGDSGSGKSTLTAALVHAGLRYFSDDLVPLDGRTRRIMPMPLGISVKEGSWPVLATRYPELQTLPVHAGPRRRYVPIAQQHHGPVAGLPVRCLVFPRFRPDQPTSLHPLTALQVLERLASVRSWMSLDGRRFGGTLRWIEETPAYELSHASLDEGVLVIERLLDEGIAPGSGGRER